MDKSVFDDYECDGQMDLEDCLWAMGYYMPLPVEDEDGKDGDANGTT